MKGDVSVFSLGVNLYVGRELDCPQEPLSMSQVYCLLAMHYHTEKCTMNLGLKFKGCQGMVMTDEMRSNTDP